MKHSPLGFITFEYQQDGFRDHMAIVSALKISALQHVSPDGQVQICLDNGQVYTVESDIDEVMRVWRSARSGAEKRDD